MTTIDLNCDMGESFGAYSLGMDEEILRYITSANIACGWHAGDPVVMDKTVRMAADRGVGIGAHPGYPDLMGFGRRRLACSMAELRSYMIYQIGALQAFCHANGVRLRHVKPHGALYLDALDNEEVAKAIAQAVAAVDEKIILVTLAGKVGDRSRAVAVQAGIRTISEAFADRAYTPTGTLAPRNTANAVIKDPETAARNALMMVKEGKTIATDGSIIAIEARTLCVHGDTPGALEIVRAVCQRFADAGIKPSMMGA